MKTIIVVIIVLLGLLTLTQKKVNIMPFSKNDTILAFGDSLTYGFGANPGESYPDRLAILSGHKIINAGVNGDTSSEGLQRLPYLLEDENIKLMILCFGGNDIIQKHSMSRLKQNLKTMIRMAKNKNIDVLLLSVPNLSLFGLSPLELYEEVAEEEKIPLLSGVLADILSQPSLKNDQIHPNALGYKKMAELIYESLKENGWAQK
jgi:lysophospholipase L1-like esterase